MSANGRYFSVSGLVADATARIVTAREALEDGDLAYCAEILRDLELDLAAWAAWRQERAA